MARMPAAEWVGEQSPRNKMDRYDIVCIHTIVGFAPAHAAHFSVKANGHIFQSRDTAFQSAANLKGNHRVIAVENEDHGDAFPDWNINDGHAVPGFTDAQVEANAKILAWAHKTHGIPLELCPNSRSTSRGLAYHRQGIDGNFGPFDFPGRVSGGEVWTEHFGKVCPGDRRIARRDDILRRARQIVNGDWFDMATKAELSELLDAKLAPVKRAIAALRTNEFDRDQAQMAVLKAIVANVSDDATKAELDEARAGLAARIVKNRKILEAELAQQETPS